MGSPLYQVFSDVLRNDSIPSATRPQRRSESWIHRSPLSSRRLRILYSLARICPKLRVIAAIPKLGVPSMDYPFMGVPTMGISIEGTPIIRTSIMGITIESVPIVDALTIGSPTHYGYIYNGYLQIAHCNHYGCVGWYPLWVGSK